MMLEVDYRWRGIGDDKPEQEEFYLLSVTCYNCGERHIGKFGKGEARPMSAEKACPFCGVRNLGYGSTQQARAWLGESVSS